MKKNLRSIISVLVIFAMLISAVPALVTAETGNLHGDANNDGSMNISDVTLILQSIAKWDVTVQDGVADVNGDGNINISDVTLILQAIAKWNVELSGNHLEEPIPDTAGTCIKEGTTGGIRCKFCIKTISEPEKTGYGTHITEKVPASEGQPECYKCTVCNKKFTDAAGTDEILDSLRISDIGITNFTIVKSADSSQAEDTAADEMAYYLEAICGFRPAVITDSSAKTGPEIVLGYTERIAANSAVKSELGDEGFIIRTDGDSLYILGSDIRGTLYGVYTFLEDYLGCRFYSKTFEVVPTANDINLVNIDDKQIPKFEFRDSYWYSLSTRDSSAKTKVNSNHGRDYGEKLDASVGGGITYAEVLPDVGFVHTLPFILKTKIPTYDVYTPICFTSSKNYNIVVNFVRDYLKNHPDETIISLSHNDGAGACGCSNCQNALRTETYSGIMLKFINKIAAEFEDEYPNLRFDTLAYRSTQGAPKNVVPNSNVIIRFCAIDTCFRHPISTDCPEWGGGRTYDDLVAWSKICKNDNLYIWNYTTNFTDFNMTYANFDNFWNDMQLFLRLGVTGVFQQGNIASDNGEFGMLKGYIIAKLLWDPEMSEAEYWAMIDEFLYNYYGEGGKHLREFIDYTLANSENEHFGIYFDDPGNYVYEHSYGTSGEGYFKGRKAYTAHSQELFSKAKSLATPEQLDRIEQAEIQVYNYIVFTCQKEGGDSKTLVNANKTIYNRLKKYGITHVVEFTPWDNKLVNFYTYVLQWGWDKRSEWSKYEGPYGSGKSKINWGTVNLNKPDQK